MTTPAQPQPAIDALQRWGVSTQEPWPVYALMPDGYWTPWHLAAEALASETQARQESENAAAQWREKLAAESGRRQALELDITAEREARQQAERLSELACKARDGYDEERRAAYQEMCGWKGRAEQAERERDELRGYAADVWDALADDVARNGERGVPEGSTVAEGVRSICAQLTASERARAQAETAHAMILSTLGLPTDADGPSIVMRIRALRDAETERDQLRTALEEVLATVKPYRFDGDQLVTVVGSTLSLLKPSHQLRRS